MINLETRKKLKELELFKKSNDCEYREVGEGGNYFTSGKCPNKELVCEDCEHYLPDPTLDELIDAIEEKMPVGYSLVRQRTNDNWKVFFANEFPVFGSRNLKQALAKALIWLYEKGE